MSLEKFERFKKIVSSIKYGGNQNIGSAFSIEDWKLKIEKNSN